MEIMIVQNKNAGRRKPCERLQHHRWTKLERPLMKCPKCGDMLHVYTSINTVRGLAVPGDLVVCGDRYCGRSGKYTADGGGAVIWDNRV